MATKRPIMQSAFKKATQEIDAVRESVKNKENIVLIPMEFIHSPKTHDRICFDESEIKELADSIKKVGLLQPIIVRKVAGRFERLVGFKRIMATKLNEETEIKAIVLENITDEQAALITISENLFRSNPNSYDQTLAFLHYAATVLKVEAKEIVRVLNKYKASKELSQDEINIVEQLEEMVVENIAIKLRTFADKLKVLNINPLLIEAIQRKELIFSIAILLDGVKDEDKLREYIERALIEKLTLAQTKKMIGGIKNKEEDVLFFLQKKYKKTYSKLSKDKQSLIEEYLLKIDGIIKSEEK